MEQQDTMRGRLLAAGLVVLVLNLTGVVLLGFSQEMLRSDLAALARQVRETPAPVSAQPLPPDPSPDLAALRASVDKLTTKVNALVENDPSKSVGRLTLEVKNLASRVEALASAKSTPPHSTRSAAPKSQNLLPPPRPYFGPDYPAWPGY